MPSTPTPSQNSKPIAQSGKELEIPVNAFKKQKNRSSHESPYKMTLNGSNNAVTDSLDESSQLNVQEEDVNASQSDDEQIKQQTTDIVTQLQKKQRKQNANAKMIVGTAFSFDITEFFKFEKKKKLIRLDSKEGDLFTEISGGVLAWIILLYSVLNASMIPAWIMNIKATKLLRIGWRFLMQSIMVIPFVLYERRLCSEDVKYQYTFWHIIKPQHLKKVYMSSVATSFWFTFILTVFEWTYISHGLVLGSLSNFFLSIYRSRSNSNHDLEPGGQVLVVLGVILVIYDSYSLQPSQATQAQFSVINPFYLSRQWYQRVAADLVFLSLQFQVALVVSFCMAKFSQYTSDLKSHYPPYLSMLLVNLFMCVNMTFSTYFFNGATFDMQRSYGIFSLFTQQHFASFLYMSIILCFGMFISFVLVSKLFQDPIIPALAMTLDPVLASFLCQVFGVQTMPASVSFVGYLLIIPGLILILIGQCLYQRIKSKQNQIQKELQNQKTNEILKQVRQIKKLSSVTQKKNRVRKAQTMKRMLDEEIQYNQRQRAQQSSEHSLRKISSKKSLDEPLIQMEQMVDGKVYNSLDSNQKANFKFESSETEEIKRQKQKLQRANSRK